MSHSRGCFITVEGIEGVGKSSNIDWIVSILQQQQLEVVLTREPGGTEIAEQIRQILLAKHQETMASDTELLLMFASRAQHLASLIKPSLAMGKWVVSDRFTDASFAYQGGGRGINKQRIEILEQWVQGALRPDLTIILDAPVEVALGRMKQRGKQDRIEAEQEQFFMRARTAYLERAAESPQRYVVIDANQPLPEVQQHIKVKLIQFLKTHKI